MHVTRSAKFEEVLPAVQWLNLPDDVKFQVEDAMNQVRVSIVLWFVAIFGESLVFSYYSLSLLTSKTSAMNSSPLPASSMFWAPLSFTKERSLPHICSLVTCLTSCSGELVVPSSNKMKYC